MSGLIDLASLDDAALTAIGAGGGLTRTAVRTSAYTAAAGDLIPVDTTAGNVTVTLPTAPADKAKVAVKHIIQGGTNTVTVACGGSDVLNKTGGNTTATLTLVNQGATYEYQASTHIWTVTAGDLPLTGLTGTFAPLLGASYPVAVPVGSNVALLSGVSVPAWLSKVPHKAAFAASSIQLVYGAPVAAEDVPRSQQTIRASVETSAGAVIPVTFRGLDTVTLDVSRGVVTSDPVSIPLASGDTFYTRTYVSTPMTSATTLAGAASISDTTLTVTAAPPATVTYPLVVSVNTGGLQEVLTVTGVTGSGPYTYALKIACTKAHASGVALGTQVTYNGVAAADTDTGTATSTTDLSQSGTPTAISAANGTLGALTSIGDTLITVNSNVTLNVGGTITVDTSGNAETVTVLDILNNVYPLQLLLTAPLTKAHASGVAVTNGAGTANVHAPIAVLAKPTTTPVKPVVVLGDSIGSGQGFFGRSGLSFITYPLRQVNRPHLHLAKGGETAQTFAAIANSHGRRRLFQFARGGWAIIQYGINDVAGSRTLLQMQTDIGTIIAACRAEGMKVAITTLTPRTTSTDGWVTVANQTVGSFEAVRLAYNAWVIAGAGGLVDKVIDPATSVTDASGVWIAPSGRNVTIDGIHPTMRAHLLMAAAVTAALPTMT